jgi:hypothetical protein
LRNWLTGLRALLALARPRNRVLWAEMRAYVRALPGALQGPLPEALKTLTPATADLDLPERDVRVLADAAALAERGSPLGLCLRRSLMRYHYLRRARVPVAVQFGARFKGGQADRDVSGHAWVTLNGEPYYEVGENHRGFTVMLRSPDMPNSERVEET